MDRSNRSSFVDKKCLGLWKATLVRQKEDHEQLVNSIFPRAVAKDLIKREKTSKSTRALLDPSRGSNLAW